VIGIDTNVLVRYLTQDDPAQAKKANEIVASASARGERLRVDVVVLCELVWVLMAAYDFNRSAVADTLEQMLGTSLLHFDDKESVRQAAEDFRHGKGDFADYVIGNRNRRAGCVETITFDRALKNDAAFRVI
jgi:predicted nucleic-acid-binding protein